MSMMKLMLITADPQLALRAQSGGVARIMVDLERNGKFERQKNRNTWISKHEIADVAPVAAVLSTSELIVRINPAHQGSAIEIDAAIAAGAQFIMLPMFNSLDDIDEIGRLIGGRSGFIPLVETADAFEIIGSVAEHEAVTEIFVGLNDLHLSLGLAFMFEPLASGLLDKACAQLARSGKPYGFGGIARVGEGDLSAELIMREHARLGSTRVILSRTFARSAEEQDLMEDDEVFPREVKKIVAAYTESNGQSDEWMRANHLVVKEKVADIVKRSQARKIDAG